jgi:hypothetical protein
MMLWKGEIHASFVKFMMTRKCDDDIALDEIFQTHDTFQNFCTAGTSSVALGDSGRFSSCGLWVFFTCPFAFGEGFDDG